MTIYFIDVASVTYLYTDLCSKLRDERVELSKLTPRHDFTQTYNFLLGRQIYFQKIYQLLSGLEPEFQDSKS